MVLLFLSFILNYNKDYFLFFDLFLCTSVLFVMDDLGLPVSRWCVGQQRFLVR